jgi:hypothetical protein
MKKLIITLTLGIAMMSITSCRWIHETFYSVEGCAEWYLEELYDAAADNDVSDFRERWDQMQEWENDLSASDLEKSYNAGVKWGSKNPSKTKLIYEFAYEHNISIL